MKEYKLTAAPAAQHTGQHIARVASRGLKRDCAHDLGRLALFVGPNGSGKSTVLDAIRFAAAIGDPAGVGGEGPALRAVMPGDAVRVTLTAADARTVTRSRVVEEGKRKPTDDIDAPPPEVFRKSSWDGDPAAVFGSAAPVTGAGMLAATSGELIKMVASVGALFVAGDPFVDAAAVAREAGIDPDAAGDIGDRMEALDKRIAAAVKAATTKEAAADAVHAAAKKDAQDDPRGAPDTEGLRADLSEAETEHRSAVEHAAVLRARADELRRTAAQATGAQTVSASERHAAAAALRAAGDALGDAHGAEAGAQRAVDDAKAATCRHREDVAHASAQEREARAALAAAPCSAAADWLSAAVLHDDPFAETADLAGACPLLASARAAVARAAERVEDDDARTRALGAAEARAEVALEVAVVARAAAAQARNEAVAAVAALPPIAAGDPAQAAEDLAALEPQLAEAIAEEARLNGARAAAASRLEYASCAATRAADVAKRRGELKDAQAALVRAKAAKAALTAARAKLATAGASALVKAAAPFMPAPWRPVLRDGWCGVSDGAAEWGGAGLSGAQRAALTAALDVALAEVYGATMRLVLVELDALDPDATRALLRALAADERVQAVAATCHEPPADALDGWQVVRLTIR